VAALDEVWIKNSGDKTMATPAPSVFKTRQELLNRLANTVEQLGKLKMQLGTLSSSDVARQRQLESEVKGLRDEYANIKAALESQRAPNESAYAVCE
jgi:uncharacterized protein involved in exopolysaccharide biosynthesis